ncbi:MAG: HAD hydrolase family protein [Treponema sp.]|jgi:hydroxymethylpyrimidine pyrophosphatase-like HAD family hydrolase|nr:HAD hydrolase family protein [Treponema sp.]
MQNSNTGHTRKAVFLDIDGTLIPQGQAMPGAEDAAAVELTHNAGHLIFLSTARSLANIPPEFTAAPWLDGIVAAGGAHVLLKDAAGLTTVYHTFIPVKLLSAMYELYERLGKWCLFEGETDLFAVGRVTTLLLPREPLALEHKNDFVTKYPDTAISKITMEGDIAAAERDMFGDILHLYPQTVHHDGIIRGESKSKGMLMALEAVGIRREHSIAIGDSANDLDMIRAAGTGIAMGNACDELKAAAAHITGDVMRNGVAQALRTYV